jgi:hypothetical protein
MQAHCEKFMSLHEGLEALVGAQRIEERNRFQATMRIARH